MAKLGLLSGLRLRGGFVYARRLLSNGTYRPIHDAVLGFEHCTVAKARRILDAPPRYLAQVKTDCLLTQRLPKRFTERLLALEALRHPDAGSARASSARCAAGCSRWAGCSRSPCWGAAGPGGSSSAVPHGAAARPRARAARRPPSRAAGSARRHHPPPCEPGRRRPRPP